MAVASIVVNYRLGQSPFKLHAALHRSTLKRVKMHVASATCEARGPLKSTDQLDGIGLFIVPCVPNISLFIVDIIIVL